jgi:hypothetical protein
LESAPIKVYDGEVRAAVQRQARMKTDVQKDVDRILTEHRRVVGEALDRGIRKAILRHKKDNLPVAIERDGKVEVVKPEDLGY